MTNKWKPRHHKKCVRYKVKLKKLFVTKNRKIYKLKISITQTNEFTYKLSTSKFKFNF